MTEARNRWKLIDLGVVLMVAGLYFVTAKLGLSLASVNASVSPVWPPTGVAIALMLWFGYRAAPGILLGALLANYLLTDVSVATAAGISLGNTLEAFTAVYLVRRFTGSPNPFLRAIDVLKFVVFAAMLSTAVSATIGNVTLCLSGAATWSNFGRLWLTWWSGDAVGALVVTPLILSWIERPFRSWRGWRLAEAVSLFVLLAVLSATVYTNLLPSSATTRPWGHVTIPLLLWAAFRFGPRGVATAIALLSAIAIWGTINGYGGFAIYGKNEGLLFLQAYIANLAITTFSLAAIVTERKVAERRLSGSLSVTRILAESPALTDALPRILQRICKTFAWEVGAMWAVNADETALCCLKVWPSLGPSEAPGGSKFESMSLAQKFAPGIGLPGRVWKDLKPVWIPDVGKDDNFPRAAAASAEGLHAAFAFPILSGKRFLGVMEFFSHEIREPDEVLLATFVGIGSQIGQFLQRKQFEEERERLFVGEQAARNEAEEANRIKDEFLATLSHELRTPLTAMLGWLSMLRADRLDRETAAHAIETVERNARAQAQLIEDLVDVSRIAGGKLSLEVRPVDLMPVIAAAIDIVRPAANAKGIQIEIVGDASVGPVSGDPARLQQIIWNLLSNAVKFTSRDGCVSVLLRRWESSAELVFRDTGMGIDPDFLPHVFDRFRQAEAAITRSHRGLGLGLAIVRHLTELHGGTISAESPGEGLGSTFTIRIPLAALQLEGSGVSDREALEIKEPARPPLDGLRVLVVEDEPDARELLALTLEVSGATVEAVESAQAALNNMPLFKPDVLLSDIGLPIESGYDLIRKVRSLSSESSKIPAVALTAFATEKDRQMALSAGFQDHLAKPVEPTALVELIERLANDANSTRKT
jgi:signal transduction histidine kinase/integral membrane sensor domain MASE1/CheY-like chemotaxis protein